MALNRRIFFILFSLFILCSMGVVYVQTQRLTPLIDYSYQVENAFRIFQHEMVYRDFFLVLPPGIYIIMAIIMNITGGYSHHVQVVMVVFLQALTMISTYAVLRLVLGRSSSMLFILLPLLFGGHAIYPFPSYDIEAGVVMTIAMYWIIRIFKGVSVSLWSYFLVGLLVSLPFLFKQNIGIVFIITTLFIFGVKMVMEKTVQSFTHWITIIFGIILILGGFVLWLQTNGAFGGFIDQVFRYPSLARDPKEGFIRLMENYHDAIVYIYTIGWRLAGIYIGILVTITAPSLLNKFLAQKNTIVSIRWLSIGIMICFFLFSTYLFYGISMKELYVRVVPLLWMFVFVFSIAFLVMEGIKKSHTKNLWVVIPVVTVQATFLSQGVVGSSYGMWPLWVILSGYIFSFLNDKHSLTSFGYIVLFFCFGLTGILGWSVYQNVRLQYVAYDGMVQTATRSAILGMKTPGEWISTMENMYSFVEKEIPMTDSVAFFPGEDPFYAVTERNNPLPFSQLSFGTYPVTVENVIRLLHEKNVKWVVVKQQVQVVFGFVYVPIYEDALKEYYTPLYTIPNYIIYKKNEK